MSNRRGIALLTALWLVVAIATIALQFSLDAKERRALGMAAAERGHARAATAGALALLQSRLDQALRAMPASNARIASLRASDPWLDVDSLYSGPVVVDSTITVDVMAHDLGTRLNVNQLSEDELRTFFGFVLNDYSTADRLAQAIMDWRDPDDLPRVSGAERDDYVRASRLTLPANQPFRDLAEMLEVNGMTPEIFGEVEPYLTTIGNGVVNLNTAPAPVLRVLPGMTDAILNQILSLRSQGQRIQSVAQVLNAAMGPRPGRPMPGPQGAVNVQRIEQLSQRLATRATVTTQQVELTLVAHAGPSSPPTRLTAIIQRGNGNAATIAYREW